MISIFRRYKNNLFGLNLASSDKTHFSGSGKTGYPINMAGLGSAVYAFDKGLNQFIYNIGSSFQAISQCLRKLLHTGYWRRYALVIFSSIIVLILLYFFSIL
jgi:hypothetical protein